MIVGEAFVAIKPDTSAFAADAQRSVAGQAGSAAQQFSQEFSAGLVPDASAFASAVGEQAAAGGSDAGEQFSEQFAGSLDPDVGQLALELGDELADAGGPAGAAFSESFSETLSPDTAGFAAAIGDEVGSAGASAGQSFSDGFGGNLEPPSVGGGLTDEIVAEVAVAGGEAGRDFGQSFNRTLVDVGLAAGAVAVLRRSLGEFDEAQRVIAQTGAVLRSTGGAANVTEEDIDDLTSALSRQAAVDDDVIRRGANLLLTFTNVRNEVDDGTGTFDRATETLVDMAAALGQDPANAAVLLGKALNDPIRGLTALTRVGVTFNDQQRDQIRTMTEAGDVVGAQAIILDELAREFGGSAEAQATGLARIRVASGELAESIGGALAPAVEGLVPLVSGAVDVFDDLPGPIQTVLTVGLGFVALAGPLGRTVQGFRSLSDVMPGLRSGGVDAADGLSRVTGIAGKVALGVGAVTAAVGIASIAIDLFTDDNADAEEAADRWNEALGRVDGSLRSITANTILAGLEEKGLADDLARTGITADELAASLAGNGENIGSLINRMRAASGGSDELQRFIGLQADAWRDAAIAQIEYARAAGLSDEELLTLAERAGASDVALGVLSRTLADDVPLTKFNVGITDLGILLGLLPEEFTAAGDAAGGASGGVDEFGNEVEETGGQALTAQERIDRLTQAVGAFFDESTRHIDAAAAFRDSLRDLADVGADVVEQNITGEERVDRFTNAISSGVRDIDAYVQSLIEGGASTDEVVAQTQAMVDELFAAADQAGLTADEVDFLRAAYGLLPEQVETTIETNAAQVGLDLDAILAKLDEFGGRTLDLQLDDRLFGGPRQHGGAVWPGGSFTVGEAGRELFVPDVPGTILPNDLTDAVLGGAGMAALLSALAAAGGSSQPAEQHTWYISSTDPLRTAAEIVAAQRRSRYRRAGLR